MANEAKRHHYIPQFILRNFNDENGQITYWDIENRKLEKRNTRSVFMNMNMYRNEEYDNPVQTELDFSTFECEIAELINKKIFKKNMIVLSRRELETLRIFLTLMSFRSDLRMKQYAYNNFDPSTREILLKMQPDGDFVLLWKRELNTLAKCRRYDEIESSEGIDPIIKLDFLNDLKGYYMTFVDARGGNFLITDIYPTLEIFPLINSDIHLHAFYPLSPTRMLVLNHIMFRKEIENTTDTLLRKIINISKIKGNLVEQPLSKYKTPGTLCGEDEFTYRVRKIYDEDVEYINFLFLNEARTGVSFDNAKRVKKTINNFNKRDDVKAKYIELANCID